jgi:drug/metabolite transporter (DMT)-like permease
MEENAIIDRRIGFWGYSACFVAGCLWGTGFYFGRLALNEMSVEHMVLYRFLFACLGMLPVALLHRRRVRLTGDEARLLLLCAAVGVPLQFLLQFHGLARTTVSHASLMVGAMPVMLAAAAAIFSGDRAKEERLDGFSWLALCASTVGAVLIALGGSRGPVAHGQPTMTGDLLIVASLFTSLAWILFSKKLMQTHSPSVVTAYTIFSGTIMLAVWVLGPWLLSPFTHARVTPPPFAHVSLTAWIALAISGVFCTATTTLLWNWGINHVPASRAGVFLNIEPALGAWLGVQLLGERLGPYAWAGGALILIAAVALTTRSQPPGSAPEPAVLLE